MELWGKLHTICLTLSTVCTHAYIHARLLIQAHKHLNRGNRSQVGKFYGNGVVLMDRKAGSFCPRLRL